MDSSLPAHYSRFANYRSCGEWSPHSTRFGVPPEMGNINSMKYAIPALINTTSSDNGATASDAEISFVGYVVSTLIKIVVNYAKKSLHVLFYFSHYTNTCACIK